MCYACGEVSVIENLQLRFPTAGEMADIQDNAEVLRLTLRWRDDHPTVVIH